MKDWKACERRVAELLGGRRVPVSGRQRGDTPDVLHEWLSIEVKFRRRLPAWIEVAMKQAEASAKEGQGLCSLSPAPADRVRRRVEELKPG